MADRIIFHPRPAIRTADGELRRISPQVAQFLMYLMTHEFAWNDRLIEYMWPNPDNSPQHERDALRAIAEHTKTALKNTSWNMVNYHGRGWSLEHADGR